MIAGTASMGFRSEEITRDRERREEKASEKAPAPAPNTPAGADGSGTPVADGVPLEAPPVPLRRMSTFARMSRSMSKIKAPIPKFFRKGVVAVSSDAAGEIVARMAQDQPVSFRERLFLVMTEPSTGRVAKLVATFSWLVVLADGAATILETEAAITEATGTMFWVYYKFAINFAFTVEAIVRFSCFIPLAEAWRQPFTWLDLLTLIPFYIRIGFFWDTVAPGTASLSQARRRRHHHHHHHLRRRLIRPAPLLQADRPFEIRILESLNSLRMFKLIRYYEGAQILVKAVVAAAGQVTRCCHRHLRLHLRRLHHHRRRLSSSHPACSHYRSSWSGSSCC